MLGSACELSFDVLLGSFEHLQWADIPCFNRKLRTAKVSNLAVSWWRPEGTSKRPQLRGVAVQLEAEGGGEEESTQAIVKRLADEAAEGGHLFNPIEQKEVRALTVSVSILEKVSDNLSAFVVGKHGVIVELVDGKRIVHLLATIDIDQIVNDAKTKGGVVSSVKIFQAKPQERLSFRQYCKIKPIWNMREALLEPYLSSKDIPKKAKPQQQGFNWRALLVVFAVVVAFLMIRFGEVTYNVDWENFRENYGILGLSENAPLKDVKRVYRRMSLKMHPDKGGDPDNWVRLTKAYKEITDFHKGTLKILDRPTRFEYEYSDQQR